MRRHIQLEAQGDIAVVRIDRPPANAMDLELLEEGRLVVSELTASEPGAVVITGREGFFSAGVDLKLAPTLDAAAQRAMVDGINRVFAGWYGFPRPVVCAVNGHAIAGGLILALCGDYRIGAGVGKFGLTELRAGAPYPGVAMAVVKAELGPAAARELVLGADLVDAQRALAIGALDELVAPAELLPRALEVAHARAELPSSTHAFVKRQLRAGAIAEMQAIIDDDSDPLRSGWLGAEMGAAAAQTLQRGGG